MSQKKLQERHMTSAEKQKEETIKAKVDKSGMKASMMKQYGPEKGKSVYFASIRKRAMESYDSVLIAQEEALAEGKSLHKMSADELKTAFDANEAKIKEKGRVTMGHPLIQRRRAINLHREILKKKQGMSEATEGQKVPPVVPEAETQAAKKNNWKAPKKEVEVAPGKTVEEGQHYCAKHVFSEAYGEGIVLEGEHAEPDENGLIEWYTVEFEHGQETVFTEDLKIMMAEYHDNHAPAKTKADKDDMKPLTMKTPAQKAAEQSKAAEKRVMDWAKGKQNEEVESDKKSHQYKTTMKHAVNPTYRQRIAAHDIKPGVAGYRDRIALLHDLERTGKSKAESFNAGGTNLPEEVEHIDEADELASRGYPTVPNKVPDYMAKTQKGKQAIAAKNVSSLKNTIKSTLKYGRHPKPNLPEDTEQIGDGKIVEVATKTGKMKPAVPDTKTAGPASGGSATVKEIENVEAKNGKISEANKWIAGAIKHPGALHKKLGVPEGEKIPAGKLEKATHASGTLGKQARLAQTLKKLKHGK